MAAVPSQRGAFTALVQELFPAPELAGLVVRPLDVPGGPQLTVAYLAGLVEPADLERLVLAPLAQGLPAASPGALVRAGRLPAPHLQEAGDAAGLQEGLLAGRIALHVDGHAGALLVGTGRPAAPPQAFPPGLEARVALLHRLIRSPALRLEPLDGGRGGRSAVAYLQGVADPETVQAVRAWARQLGPQPRRLPWWQALIGLLRLPPAVEAPAPAAVAVAEAMRRGYVAVLADHQPGARLAPATLELLLGGPEDVGLPLPLRVLAPWPRLLAALFALAIGAGFIAITSYHHSLLPGPFLIALASTRQNNPLPTVMEVPLMHLLDDCLRVGALRAGGERWSLLALPGTVLVGMVAVMSGVLSPAPVMIGIAAAVAVQVLPTPALDRVVRVWRYVAMGAAAGLGLYGIGLAAFALLVYLGEERPFGHPLRRPPAGVAR